MVLTAADSSQSNQKKTTKVKTAFTVQYKEMQTLFSRKKYQSKHTRKLSLPPPGQKSYNQKNNNAKTIATIANVS